MRKFLFADEAGDFAFKKGPNVSRYFIVCTVTADSCQIGEELFELRRELLWDRHQLGDYFHATEDKQAIRDYVFELIRQYDLRIDATILEKSKAQPQTRINNSRFYQYGWFYHFKNIAPGIINSDTELMITAASLGTKRERALFTQSVNEVAQQIAHPDKWVTAFCPAANDPCLQVVDYCTWAIQRKWERGDTRSYDLIKNRIRREFDLWQAGTTHYY